MTRAALTSPKEMLQAFLRLEAAGGLLLALAAVVAMVMVNSPLQSVYDGFLNTPVVVQIGALELAKPLLLWINDGLMAVFFLLVGLEIKREVLEGQLSRRDQISLPALAALGGLAVPALIYVAFNMSDAAALKGWAIPAATDIAFALGVVALLGSRIPPALKITLLAVAIIDDLAAIVIIAVFYTENLSLMSLGLAAVCIVALAALNIRGVTRTAPYILIGVILWVCVLKSGVHATLAGVALAMFIPLKKLNADGYAPARKLEHDLHPWIAYGVLPVFAFANAGVALGGLSLEMLAHPVTLGVAAGLFFGKQIGVMLITAFGVFSGLCGLPEGVSWGQYYGLALITGVGFTMSLFIGALAFSDPETQNLVRLGVLSGSLAAGLAGYVVLRLTSPNRAAT